MIFVSGSEVDQKVLIDDVEFGCPIVAAGSPLRRGGEDPTDLSEISASGAFPDGKIVSIPAFSGDCIVGSLIVEYSWVWGVSFSLHWINISVNC